VAHCRPAALNLMTRIGQYTLLAEIGRSVLGAVYRAVDMASGRTIALKVLNLEMLDDVSSADMNARLQRDLNAVSRLTHPGIAGVFDVRREGNLALIAMELVEGPRINSFAAAQGGFDVSQSVTAVAQILEALAFAHCHGVIHRDLKPSNVLVSQGTHTKITDFGMAELAARNRTQTGLLVGTMQYMAPEQFLGHPIDERCDIHAAGTILYELLTGESPFADARGFSMPRVLESMPPPPSEVRSGLTAAFDGVVARALAKSPADRFATAQAFRYALCAAYFAVMRQAPPDTLARSAPPASIPLTDESIALGGRVLAQFVGPIAIVLSRKAVQDACDERAYFELLAAHLPDATERTRFLHAVGY
jgi:eukaryotic-like serine/threonine-protein kinase